MLKLVPKLILATSPYLNKPLRTFAQAQRNLLTKRQGFKCAKTFKDNGFNPAAEKAPQ